MRIVFLAAVFFLATVSCPVLHAQGDTPKIMDELEKLIDEEALVKPDLAKVTERSAKAYLAAIDPYSIYLSPEDVKRQKSLAGKNYSGLGIDLIANTKGDIICLPFAGGPAQLAGVAYGDRLISVDGQSVLNQPLTLVAQAVRGPEGTEVSLVLKGANNAVKTVTARRAAIKRQNVTTSSQGEFYLVKVNSFEGGAAADLAKALAERPEGTPVIIDLRGNIGGELKEGVSAAEMFLNKGETVVTVTSRTRAQRAFRAGGNGKYRGLNPVIWQDHLTASASEVFIAALTQNKKAVSLGRQSFGKGVSQRLFSAKNGGIFQITTGELLPPQGRSFNGLGLKPDLLVGDGGDEAYLRRSREALSLTGAK